MNDEDAAAMAAAAASGGGAVVKMIIEEWPFVGSGLEAEAADHERKLANRKRRLEDYQADLEVPFEPDEYHEHSEALRELWRALQPTATYLRLEKLELPACRIRARS